VIGADDVTLDLDGHVVDGDGTEFADCSDDEFCDFGILSVGHDGVAVRDGTVRGFAVGVLVGRARDNRVLSISVEEGRGNLVARNAVIDARGNGIRLGLDRPAIGGAANVVPGNLVRRSAAKTSGSKRSGAWSTGAGTAPLTTAPGASARTSPAAEPACSVVPREECGNLACAPLRLVVVEEVAAPDGTARSPRCGATTSPESRATSRRSPVGPG
jgi:hypothetical protein